jgi:predicted RNA-binding Zn-ribbon protein involved in translation (DUF1610 family)
MFCKKCGMENDNDAKFCKSCGSSIAEEKETSMYDGKIKKCPNCGELVDSFTLKCKACGYEFRDTNVVSSINELKKSLETIYNSDIKDSILDRTFGQVGQRTRKMVEVIKNFNIPNTKEDIIELMFLASSNIIIDNTMNSNTTLRTNDNALSDAWKSKMEQAYQKAKITLNNDPSFSQIEDIYLRKTKEIMNAKRIGTIKFILFFAGIISIFILPLILLLLLYK